MNISLLISATMRYSAPILQWEPCSVIAPG